MHKNGHAGVSLILASPFVAIFLVFDLYVVSFLFVALTLTWSPLPDIDIYLQKYEPVSFSSYPVKHWEWIPLLKLTCVIMNYSGRHISKVPENYEMEEVTHRGLTHSLWFSIAFGFVVSIISLVMLLCIFLVDIYSTTPIYSAISDVLKIEPMYLVVLSFIMGFLSICFHCVGDVFTPTGIHFLTPKTDYGYTLDLFYAKNEVANRSALPVGIIMMSYSILFGYFFGQVDITYLVAGFVGLAVVVIPLWLLFIKTQIGEWFYKIYDFFR